MDQSITIEDSLLMAVVGAGLLIGFVVHIVGRRAHVPRVTLLLVVGALIGPSGFDVVPGHTETYFPMATQAALSMVGFGLGSQFERKKLRRTGRVVLGSALTGTLVPVILVAVGLLLIGVDPVFAVLLGSVAAATSPAATYDVIRETRSAGDLTDTLEGVVAVDDGWAVLIFSVIVVIADFFVSGDSSGELLGRALAEMGGSVALGAALGLPMAWVTGRVKPGELTLVESFGFVLLAGGLSGALQVDYLMTSMTMGAVVANRGRHHEEVFHSIEGSMDPFLILFFLLAGFEFDVHHVLDVGLISFVYLLLRGVGKALGGALGARWTGAPPVVRRYLGWTLLPQAGVALGMGLVAAERFPQVRAELLSVLVGTTVVFEVVGPILTRMALVKSGEAGRADVAEV